MPHFYDLDAPVCGDSREVSKEEGADADDLYEHFESLREMLAWSALSRFRLNKASQTCHGTFSGDPPNLLVLLEPVMSRLGFTQPIPTGSFRGLYERDDAAMICNGSPEQGVDRARTFELGGPTPGVF